MKRVFTIIVLWVAVVGSLVAAEPMKLLTYNIKGHSMTSSRLEDIAAVINAQTPDIVALQEVDNRTFIGTKHDYLSELAEATGMHSSFFALVGSYYGVGLLSKTEPLSVQPQSFDPSDTSKDKEARGFLIAEFDDFYFISTHYSLNADDRDTATAWAINFARKSDKTVFIAGDFNAQPTYRAMVTFKNNGFSILNNTSAYTFPADGPTSCIDMIISYCSETGQEYEVAETGVVTSVDGLTLSDVSDHLPVYVVIDPVEGSGVDHATATREMQLIRTSGGFSLTSLQAESTVDLYALDGTLVGSQRVDNGDEVCFPASCRNGLYLVQVKNGYQNSTFKYILNH